MATKCKKGLDDGVIASPVLGEAEITLGLHPIPFWVMIVGFLLWEVDGRMY